MVKQQNCPVSPRERTMVRPTHLQKPFAMQLDRRKLYNARTWCGYLLCSNIDAGLVKPLRAKGTQTCKWCRTEIEYRDICS